MKNNCQPVDATVASVLTFVVEQRITSFTPPLAGSFGAHSKKLKPNEDIKSRLDKLETLAQSLVAEIQQIRTFL